MHAFRVWSNHQHVIVDIAKYNILRHDGHALICADRVVTGSRHTCADVTAPKTGTSVDTPSKIAIVACLADQIVVGVWTAKYAYDCPVIGSCNLGMTKLRGPS